MTLDIRDLTKSFGSKQVLDGVTFQAAAGFALGLLGRNGAGKTTTIRIIMQVFPPDGGSVLLDGKPLRDCDVRIGYLPEEKGLYPKQKVRDQMVYLARLRGMRASTARKAVQAWVERMELTAYIDKKLETLSKGNQQKIQLALALLHEPDVVILDEPFSGLDPVNAQLLKTIVKEQVSQGRIVLFSSHQMNYVEQFCDAVAILHHGKIQISGTIRDLKRAYDRTRLRLRFADGNQSCIQFAYLYEQIPELKEMVAHFEPLADDCLIQLYHAEQRSMLFQELAKAECDLDQFQVVEPSLEEIFVDKVGDGV
ncbi:MAG: ATP-binding cassette domain-containing protein [Ruminococcaceae bacterium]|jgi:ABC-2 type transport system ATP-binding protein|nr:ATP-binding cassette domain-containing protein [Oscillospiraceae bacterium]